VDKTKSIVKLPKKRKVLKEDKKPSKKARNNMEKTKEKVEQSHILSGGSRLDTTLAVPVPRLEGGDENDDMAS
jgi:hypothetical protein